MVSKVYAVICGLFALAAAVLFLTGNFPAITAIVFGFVGFGLIFMGMMFVLPYTISHAAPAPAKKKADHKPVTVSRVEGTATRTSKAQSRHILTEPLV